MALTEQNNSVTSCFSAQELMKFCSRNLHEPDNLFFKYSQWRLVALVKSYNWTDRSHGFSCFFFWRNSFWQWWVRVFRRGVTVNSLYLIYYQIEFIQLLYLCCSKVSIYFHFWTLSLVSQNNYPNPDPSPSLWIMNWDDFLYKQEEDTREDNHNVIYSYQLHIDAQGSRARTLICAQYRPGIMAATCSLIGCATLIQCCRLRVLVISLYSPCYVMKRL